jgi:hypothetical protein
MSVLIERASRFERCVTPSDDPPKPSRLPARDVPLEVDELEDTQPSVVLPEADDDFCDAPTIPGFRLRSDGSLEHAGAEPDLDALREGNWDRVLRAVALAVKRVFASHALGRSA